MMLLFYLTCFIFKVISLTLASNVCQGPFGNFLTCAATEAQKRLGVFEREATPYVQNQIKTCFIKTGCDAPDFADADLDRLLPQTWADRMKLILELLETTDNKVQRCMIDYFANMATQKIQACIRRQGGGELSDFQMPKLPQIQGVNFRKLKHSVLNRVVVMKKTLECAKVTNSDDQLQASIDCQKSARSENPSGLCYARDSCRASTIDVTNCRNRFNKVQTAACQCFKRERDEMTSNSGNIKKWKEMFNSLFKGGFARQYNQCCIENGVKFPEYKVNNVDKAFKKALKDVIFNGLPEQAQTVVTQLMQQVSDEGQKIFCDSCSTSNFNKNEDARQIRRLARAQRNQKNNIINKGFRGLLEQLVQSG